MSDASQCNRRRCESAETQENATDDDDGNFTLNKVYFMTTSFSIIPYLVAQLVLSVTAGEWKRKSQKHIRIHTTRWFHFASHRHPYLYFTLKCWANIWTALNSIRRRICGIFGNLEKISFKKKKKKREMTRNSPVRWNVKRNLKCCFYIFLLFLFLFDFVFLFCALSLLSFHSTIKKRTKDNEKKKFQAENWIDNIAEASQRCGKTVNIHSNNANIKIQLKSLDLHFVTFRHIKIDEILNEF